MGQVTVADVTRWLDGFAPRKLAESWDNVGLLMGDPDVKLAKVMTCLTVTSASAGEAIAEGVGLIVSHHPVMFKPIQTLRADRGGSTLLWKLARAGIAIYSPHTSFDNCVGGINDGLAARLGLIEVGPLRLSARVPATKLILFVPETDRAAVLEAAFDAGAGRIGNYAKCSFTNSGIGSFVGGEGSHPSVGEVGKFEQVPECRIELICPSDRVLPVVASIRRHASYEEVAIDVIPLSPPPSGPGIGRLGRLPNSVTLAEFSRLVAHVLNSPATQFVGNPARPVERVAICCGAGDDFIAEAHQDKADVLLTGEARFHRALEAEELGLGLVVAGHYQTERPGVEDLADRLTDAFPALACFASKHETDPLRSWLRP